MPGYSQLAAPLYVLTSKHVPFEWTPECQSVFDELKVRLTTAPILALPDFGAAPFIIDADACMTGLGAVLSQKIDGIERPVAYASRTLNNAEKRYPITHLECLAVVWAIQTFRPYVYGTQFVVRSDHGPFQWIKTVQKPPMRLAKWAVTLTGYDYTVEYRPGPKHGNADGLSRRPEVNTGTGGSPPRLESAVKKQEQRRGSCLPRLDK